MHPPPLRTDLLTQHQAARGDEVEDVSALLMHHFDPSAGSPEAARAVAHTVAVACLGDNHLWQDLLFENRQQLNALLRHWFPSLVAKNSGDMKWKKFFYRQLCEAAEAAAARAAARAAWQAAARAAEAAAGVATSDLLDLAAIAAEACKEQ